MKYFIPAFVLLIAILGGCHNPALGHGSSALLLDRPLLSVFYVEGILAAVNKDPSYSTNHEWMDFPTRETSFGAELMSSKTLADGRFPHLESEASYTPDTQYSKAIIMFEYGMVLLN